MPDPEVDARHIMNALAHGLTGHRERIPAELAPVLDQGPGGMYAALSSLAEVAVSDQKPKRGQFLGIQVERAGVPASAADAPPAVRFAMQFMAAQANGDLDMTHSLFKAMLVKTPLDLADALGIVFDAAVVTVRAQAARAEDGE